MACSGRLLVLEECGVQVPVRWLEMVVYVLFFTFLGSKVGNDHCQSSLVAVLLAGLQGRKWPGTFCNL